MSGKILISDIENIEICRQTDKVLVCDDLFIRKTLYAISKADSATNFLGFLLSNNLLTNPELLDLVLQLSKDSYILCANSKILTHLLITILSIEDKNLRKTEYSKLKEIFNNILSGASKMYYEQITYEFSLMAIKRQIPMEIIYELALSPLSDKSYEEMLQDAKDKIFGDFLRTENEDTKS